MRVNLNNLVLSSAFIASVGLLGCGGSSNKSDLAGTNPDLTTPADLTGVVPPDMTSNDDLGYTPVQATETTYSGTATESVSGQTISPETAWVGGLPFIDETVTWYDDTGAPSILATGTGATGGVWTLNADQNSYVRPFIAATSTTVPSISDILQVQTAAVTGIPAHFWFNGTGSIPSVSGAVATAGGPSATALLAQGACIFEALASHTNNMPVGDYASAAVVESGWDIYTIHGDPTAMTITVTKDGNGSPKTAPDGGTGRFLMTKSGNTQAQTIHLNITDQSGSGFTWNSPEHCDVIPGNIVFRPVVHN